MLKAPAEGWTAPFYQLGKVPRTLEGGSRLLELRCPHHFCPTFQTPPCGITASGP